MSSLKRKFTKDSRTDSVSKRAKVLSQVIVRAATGRSKKTNKMRFGDTNPERKYLLGAFTGSVGNSGSPILALFNNMAQGVDANTRIGKQILMKNAWIDFTVSVLPASLATAATYPNGSDTMRVALVVDKQPNGAAPAIAQIWNTGSSTLSDPMCPRNVGWIDRYVVLRDWPINLSVTEKNAVNVRDYVQLNGKTGIPVRYSGTGAAITDISSNSLYLIAYDQNQTGTLSVNIVGTAQIFFTDD